MSTVWSFSTFYPRLLQATALFGLLVCVVLYFVNRPIAIDYGIGVLVSLLSLGSQGLQSRLLLKVSQTLHTGNAPNDSEKPPNRTAQWIQTGITLLAIVARWALIGLVLPWSVNFDLDRLLVVLLGFLSYKLVCVGYWLTVEATHRLKDAR